jgi:hypothetical protein
MNTGRGSSSAKRLLAILGLGSALVLRGLAAPAAQGTDGKARAAALAGQALAADPSSSSAAIAALRELGPGAVGALLAAQEQSPALPDRFRQALDGVCAQHDCAASHLFWYTDFEQARAEAQRTGKPILSLRLLGRLDEEMSCANSRFFRAVLYANAKVSRLLRERYVLHWRSVRPVPKLTIDFGDGRTLRGTITGNSIHYVLDPRGRLVDALPGLYGPGAFLRLLAADAREVLALAALDDARFAAALADFHRRQGGAVEEALRRDLERVGASLEAAELERPQPSPDAPDAPDALLTAYQAMPLASTKMAIEIAPLSSMSIAGREKQLLGVDWSKLADLHRADWRLDAASRAGLECRHGGQDAARLRQAVAGFERLVGLDTVRNEYLLHDVLHAWLSFGDGPLDLDRFNDRVYADLFLTPGSDPWLGLASPETFLALEPSLAGAPGQLQVGGPGR